MANTSARKTGLSAKAASGKAKTKDITLALRVDSDTLEQLDFIARGMDRSRASVCLIALREFVEREYPFHQAIAEGEADFAAGRTVPHEVVEKWMKDLIEGRISGPPPSEQ
jgi:predicted transcriptional regulator